MLPLAVFAIQPMVFPTPDHGTPAHANPPTPCPDANLPLIFMPRTRLRIVSAALLAVAWSLPLAAQDPAKPFRLFIGVDLMVKGDDDSYRRVDSLKPYEVILAEPDLPRLRLRDVASFSWERKTKVSRAPLVISDFEQHKVFSVRNDRAIQYMATQNNLTLYAQEKADFQQMKIGDAGRMVVAAASNRARLDTAAANGVVVHASSYAAADAWVEAAKENYAQSIEDFGEQALESTAIINNTAMLDEALEGTSEGGEDILALAFTVSSAEPIADAYVVVMGTVTQDEQKGVVTFHHPIGAIGPEPRKIRIRKTGFKPGFTIEDVKLHLYAYGKELATNLSERAVAMTREQAREFLLLSHIADHAVESVDPAPVWTLAPPALLAAKSAAAFNHPVVVNLDADGSVLSIHNSETEARAYLAEIHDAADLRTKASPVGKSLASSVRVTAGEAGVAFDQTGRLPAHVVAALRDMVFLPALDLGTPVPATTRINLADFFR